ncbi:MAG: serine/threonine-protein kinase, partial [Myxococcota bacterium]
MRSDRLEPGRRLSGRYVLEQPLGTGASGAVWSARDEEGGRRVALKLLHAHLLEDGGSRDPLAREHEALLQLDHPHLAQCFGLEQDGDQIFLVLELIEGEMLHVAMGARASTGARFAPHEIERWSDELASALEHAHARGVVHRDLKPQNIALERTPSGLQARLLDFGIARLLENSVFDRTTWGRKLGSVFYMSPEQIEGAPAAPTSDVFSLSSVLFELVTLRRCWVAGHPAAFAAALPRDGANVAYAVFERICHGPRPRPSEVDPMTPPSVDAVLARGLAVDPGDRYAGPHELHAALLEALAPDATRIDLAPAFGASADPDATVAFVEGVKASNIPETMAYVAASAGRSPEAASPKAGGPEPESTQMIGAADLPPTRALPRSEVEG